MAIDYDVRTPGVLQEREGLVGTVKFFDQGRSFGFITLSDADGGGDVFLHLKEVAGGKVRVGATLEFDTKYRSAEKDALRAVDVTPLGERGRREVQRLTKEGKAAKAGAAATVSFATASATAEVGLKLTAGLITSAQLSKLAEQARQEEVARQEEAARHEASSKRKDTEGGATTADDGMGSGVGKVEELQGAKKAKPPKKKAKVGALSFDVEDEEEDGC